jgi:hypothetical protein
MGFPQPDSFFLLFSGKGPEVFNVISLLIFVNKMSQKLRITLVVKSPWRVFCSVGISKYYPTSTLPLHIGKGGIDTSGIALWQRGNTNALRRGRGAFWNSKTRRVSFMKYP